MALSAFDDKSSQPKDGDLAATLKGSHLPSARILVWSYSSCRTHLWCPLSDNALLLACCSVKGFRGVTFTRRQGCNAPLPQGSGTIHEITRTNTKPKSHELLEQFKLVRVIRVISWIVPLRCSNGVEPEDVLFTRRNWLHSLIRTTATEQGAWAATLADTLPSI